MPDSQYKDAFGDYRVRKSPFLKKWIRSKRIEQDKTMREITQALGFKYFTIEVSNGGTIPLWKLAAIMDYFGVSREELKEALVMDLRNNIKFLDSAPRADDAPRPPQDTSSPQ